MSIVQAELLVIASVFAVFMTVIQTLRVKTWKDIARVRLKDIEWWHKKYDEIFGGYRAIKDELDSLEQELSALKSAPSLEQEIELLQKKIDALTQSRDNLRNDKGALSRQVMTLEAKVNEKSHEILDLKKKSTLKSESHLTEAMSGLCRFIAANQWMLENNKELRDSLESVREVSNSVESFRTDF